MHALRITLKHCKWLHGQCLTYSTPVLLPAALPASLWCLLQGAGPPSAVRRLCEALHCPTLPGEGCDHLEQLLQHTVSLTLERTASAYPHASLTHLMTHYCKLSLMDP